MGDFGYRLLTRRTAAGLTQRALAERAGVAQPLIAALESGSRQPTTQTRDALERALAMRPSQLVRAHRDRLLPVIARHGGTQPRIFGSVARGDDGPDSDLDLLLTLPSDADILDLLDLAEELSELLTVPVDVISAGSSGEVVTRALAESVPL